MILDPAVNVPIRRLLRAETLKLMPYPEKDSPLRIVAFFTDDVLGFASGVVSTVGKTE
jgi:hypothetical protein